MTSQSRTLAMLVLKPEITDATLEVGCIALRCEAENAEDTILDTDVHIC